MPALPGLGVAADTRVEVEQLIREAIPCHLDGLAADGLAIPGPESVETAAVSV